MSADLFGGRVMGDGEVSRREELVARVALSKVVEPLDRVLAVVVRELGVLDAWDAIRVNLGGRFDRCVPRVKALDVDRVLEVAARLGVQVLIPGDAGWPDRLDDLAFPPWCLWVRGPVDLPVACERSVAIVGARDASAYGVQVASELGFGLARAGFAVVSGGAFGIDAAAHRGALAAGGVTVAAMAGGVDRPYPVAHTDLLGQVVESGGGLVSEMPPGAAPQRQRFLARNRLIAALTPGVVVVEAGLRSGSLNTVRHAEELCRLVGAVPGPVTSPASAGTHQLVRDARAVLVTDVAECRELLGAIGDDAATVQHASDGVRDGLPEVPGRVFDALRVHRSTQVEQLARVAGLSGPEVIQGLGYLQVHGLAAQGDAGWRRVRAG